MADDDIRIRASLRDELSGPLRQIERRIESTARATRRLSKVAGGELAPGMGRAGRGTSDLNSRLTKLHRGLEGASSRVGSLAKTVGIGLTAALGAGAAAATYFGLKSATSLEMSRVALEGLTGSAEGATAAFDYLKALDAKAPFDIGQLSLVYQQLLNSGVAASELEATMQGVVDVAAFTPDKLGDISYALMQIKGGSKLMTQDLRQLNSAGVNIGGALEESFGITFGQFLEQAEKGADFASGPFLEALFGNSQGRAEKIATETLTGLISSVRSRVMLRLSDAANPLMQSLKANLPTIEAGIVSVIDNLAPPLMEVAAVLLDLVTKALPVLAPVLGAVASAVSMLATAAGPAFLLMGPVMEELAVAIGELATELVPVMPELVAAFIAMVRVLPAFVGLLTDMVPLLTPLAGLVTALLGFEPVRQIMGGLLFVLLGYRALAGIVGTLYAFAGGLTAVQRAQMGAGGVAGAAGRGGVGGMGKAGTGALGVAAALPALGTAAGYASGGKQTIGSDLGMIGSAAASGALIGSIIPGAGTAAGALAGGAIGLGIAGANRLFGGGGNKAQAAPVVGSHDAETERLIQLYGGGAGTTVAPGGIQMQVYPQTPMDLERAVASGIEQYDQSRQERR